MPDQNGNLYLFEAIELRNEYDRHIRLIENLIGETDSRRDRLFRHSEEEEREPAAGFDANELGKRLKKIQTKRIKLNQAIQKANFEIQIEFDGETISIAEALEIRKKLFADHEVLFQRVLSSAYKRVIHKEERDIVREPAQPFQKVYEEFQANLKRLRRLVTRIHIANHANTVKFKDE